MRSACVVGESGAGFPVGEHGGKVGAADRAIPVDVALCIFRAPRTQEHGKISAIDPGGAVQVGAAVVAPRVVVVVALVDEGVGRVDLATFCECTVG